MIPLRRLGLLAFVVVIWGANWPIMKIGLAYVEPLWFGVIRLVMGAACLLGVLAARGRLRLPAAGDLPILLSIGVLQMGGFLALINLALMHVDAGRSAILAYTTPIWVAPAAMLVLGERLSWRKTLGVILGLVGVAVLFNPFGFDWSQGAIVAGNGMLLLAAFLWAATIIHVRIHRWHGSALDLAPWQMLIGALPLSVLAWAMEGPPAVLWNPVSVAVLAYNGIVATGFCFWAWMELNRTIPVVTLSLASLAVPALGLALSVLELGEPLSVTTALGLAAITVGVALVIPEGT